MDDIMTTLLKDSSRVKLSTINNRLIARVFALEIAGSRVTGVALEAH